TFCVGADLKRLPTEVASHAAIGRGLPPTPLSGLELTKPVICAVNGDALGGGFELALGFDLRIAAEGARFGFPEARWSLVPAGGGTYRLPRLIGAARTLELMLTGEPISAWQALGWGLVQRVVPAEDLEAATERLVEAILQVGPLAARAIKALVNQS